MKKSNPVNDKAIELTPDEIQALVKTIAEPVFKYMMSRLSKEILDNKDYNNMSINSFLSILIVSMATIDANSLRWMERFYKLKVGEDIVFEKLKFAFTKNLYKQLNIALQ